MKNIARFSMVQVLTLLSVGASLASSVDVSRLGIYPINGVTKEQLQNEPCFKLYANKMNPLNGTYVTRYLARPTGTSLCLAVGAMDNQPVAFLYGDLHGTSIDLALPLLRPFVNTDKHWTNLEAGDSLYHVTYSVLRSLSDNTSLIFSLKRDDQTLLAMNCKEDGKACQPNMFPTDNVIQIPYMPTGDTIWVERAADRDTRPIKLGDRVRVIQNGSIQTGTKNFYVITGLLKTNSEIVANLFAQNWTLNPIETNSRENQSDLIEQHLLFPNVLDSSNTNVVNLEKVANPDLKNYEEQGQPARMIDLGTVLSYYADEQIAAIERCQKYTRTADGDFIFASVEKNIRVYVQNPVRTDSLENSGFKVVKNSKISEDNGSWVKKINDNEYLFCPTYEMTTHN